MHFCDFVRVGNRSDIVIELREPPGEVGTPRCDTSPTESNRLDVNRQFFLHLANQRFGFGLTDFDAATGQA